MLRLGAAAVAAALVVLAYDLVGYFRLRSAIREAREIGGALTLAELDAARPPLPDSQDAAPSILSLPDHPICTLQNRRWAVLPIAGELPLPKLGHKWVASVDKTVGGFLKARETDLAVINRLAEYEGGRLPRSSNSDPYEMMSYRTEQISRITSCADLKYLDMVYRAMHGEPRTLTRDTEVLLRLGDLVADEWGQFPQMVHINSNQRALNAIERVLSFCELPSDPLLDIQQLIARTKGQGRLELAVRGERAWLYATAEHLRKTGQYQDLIGRRYSYPIVPGLNGWLMADQALGLRLFNRLLRSVDDQEHWARNCEAISKTLQDTGPSLTADFFPAMDQFPVAERRLEARAEAARAALAAERYRLSRGEFPPALTDLVPDYLDRVPDDPFDGQALRYLREEERIVVYSVDADRIDDGGTLDTFTDQRDCGFVVLSPSARGLPPEPGQQAQPSLWPTTEQLLEMLRKNPPAGVALPSAGATTNIED